TLIICYKSETLTRRRPLTGCSVRGLLLLALLREIALAGRDEDRLPRHEVAHLDPPLPHLGEGAVAAVKGQPVRPAHRCRGVPSARPEVPLRLAPQQADRLRRGSSRGECPLADSEIAAAEAELDYRVPVVDAAQEHEGGREDARAG